MPDTISKISITTDVSHVTNGASIATANFSTTIDNALTTTNMAMYPLANVVLGFTPSSNTIAAASAFITLHRRNINISGTNDETAPSSSNRPHYAGTFIVPASAASTGTTFVQCEDVMLPGGECEFYLENNTNLTINAGWTLTVKPKTLAAA